LLTELHISWPFNKRRSITANSESRRREKKIRSQIEDENRGNDDKTIQFEFQIPDSVNQSHTGKCSEYFWSLEAIKI
jgi:hypothetical protein